jgi:hypothetical protein
LTDPDVETLSEGVWERVDRRIVQIGQKNEKSLVGIIGPGASFELIFSSQLDIALNMVHDFLKKKFSGLVKQNLPRCWSGYASVTGGVSWNFR